MQACEKHGEGGWTRKGSAAETEPGDLGVCDGSAAHMLFDLGCVCGGMCGFVVDFM